jgi:hypothetical protein
MITVAMNETEQMQINDDLLQIKDDLLQIKDDLQQIVCGSIGILDDNVLGDDYIVMPNEYFKKLQIEPFTSVKIEKVSDIKKINYINDYKNDPIVYEINNDLKIEINKIL